MYTKDQLIYRYICHELDDYCSIPTKIELGYDYYGGSGGEVYFKYDRINGGCILINKLIIRKVKIMFDVDLYYGRKILLDEWFRNHFPLRYHSMDISDYYQQYIISGHLLEVKSY